MDNLEQVEQGGDGNTKSPPSKLKVNRDVQSKHWCFTVNNPSEESCSGARDTLFSKCDKWVYQLEEGEEEKTPHWQGYFCLKKKMRFGQIMRLLSDKWHLEKCRNIDASIDYCQKADGRLEGPWLFGFRRQVRDPLEGVELFPFQSEILDLIKTEPDNRTINWYWEKSGNVGKTSLAKHIAINHSKEMLYLTGKSSDMKYAIAKFLEDDTHELRIVIMDFTRSSEDYISWQGIEEIKNGIFFTGKYEGGMLVFNSPHVICLANFKPPINKLSKDRWNIKKIK